MKKSVQIVLVGHTKERLMEGIKQFPTQKLVLVVGANQNLEGEEKVMEVAAVLENIFRELMDIERMYVDKENVFTATETILQKVKEEVELGAEVRLNVSGSLRQMAIACYIAALVSKTLIFSVLPEYDQEFKEIGIKETYEIPYIPIKEVSAPEMKILGELKQIGVIESIEQLMAMNYGDIAEKEYNKVRAKVSYYVKELEEEGFIQKRRAGQKVSLELTPLGRIYLVGQEIRMLKREKGME